MRRSTPSCIAVGLCLAGCSADAVTPPEPTIQTQGAFVSATDSDGVNFLMRTLRFVPFGDGDALLDIILYSGEPSSDEEAKEWAKDPDWPVANPSAGISLLVLQSLGPEVVWFRTVSQSELDELL